jgi:hypothetical protein
VPHQVAERQGMALATTPRLESSVDRQQRRTRSDWPGHHDPIAEFVSTESAIEMPLNLFAPNMISVGTEGVME